MPNSKHRPHTLISAVLVLISAPALALAQNQNCTLIMPASPLTAAGLMTPYQFLATDPTQGPCNEANTGQSAFVQAGIINTITGQISIYNPLVVDYGTTPAAPTTPVVLPPSSVVAIWFGYNAGDLTIQYTDTGAALTADDCHQGLAQFAYCNAPAFFTAANLAIQHGQLIVPALGTGNDGQPCPSVRSFSVVDQDQSDNLTTMYLMAADGVHTAQNTAANRAALPGSTVFSNPSDEWLATLYMDPPLGCKPWMAPDLTDAGNPIANLAMNELQAAAWQAAPIALVPLGDPFTLDISGAGDLDKVNEYRLGVNQVPAASAAQADTTLYCTNLRTIGVQKLQLDQTQFTAAASPVPSVANNLFTFLANRLVGSYGLLNCQGLLNQPDPITLSFTGTVVTGATIATPPPTKPHR